MESKSHPKLYISYSKKDREIVDRLAARLISKGIDVIFDNNLIKDGGDWKEALMKGITGADVVLVLISPNSISSNYVMNELGMARGLTLSSEQKKLLLPIIYGEVTIPDFIKDIQAIFWRGNDDEVVDRIIKAVFDFIGQKNEPEPKQSKVVSSENRRRRPEKNIPNKDILNEAISKNDSTRNHWLFKMNPKTWEIEHLKVDEHTFFSTHFFKEKRPEYELFDKIKKGDHILGFAAEGYQSIVCLMEVTKPVGPNRAQGEGFEMVVKRVISPGISLQSIKNSISEILPVLVQNKKPPELFFKLSETSYREILSAGNEPLKLYENVYQPFYVTEGNHRITEDQLGFQNDINSFASVITLQKVNPPLAIGLFGNWGSGKSFFMEKLSECIETICNDKEEGSIENVVQVKFNSWHYSDTNLWASLITQIFESLHDYATKKEFGPEAIKTIYKDLNITSQQLEETQKKLDANAVQATVLQEQKANVEEIIQQKKEALGMWTAKDLIKLVFSDPYIQQDFENIKKQFEEEKLIDNIHQIDEKIARVDSVGGQVVESFELLKKNRKGKWIWVWIWAVLIGVSVWLVLGPLKTKIEEFISGGIAATAILLGSLTTVIAKLSPYFNKISQFYKRLKSLKETIDTEKEKVKLKEHDEVNRLNKEISDLNAEKTALEAKQAQTAERKAKLENEIKEIGSGKLLANFLADKSTDDAYIKQLGIISWVRKDFAKLNELFQKQKSVQANEKELPVEVQIDRIVLYIDDLDRCNEDVVVKVLEAIHLLLAFPLFVVIVGVDPRWLNNALSEKYKTLFGYTGEKNIKKDSQDTDSLHQSAEDNSLFDGVATSYDYLEKIFQIPFALKPINKTGREKLIKYLIREEMADDKNVIAAGENVPAPPDENIKNIDPVSPALPLDKKDDKNMSSHIEEEKQENAKKIKERLVFTAAELAYMQQISLIFGQTPRAINRYVNVYRIIKAHGNLKVAGDFSKDEFMPIMLVLAVIVGYSAFAEEFIDQISKTEDDDTFKDFIDKSVLHEKLKKTIKPLTLDIETLPMENFKRNVELISRFSFRTLLK